ncbi:DUF4286 family protein [Rhodoplanes sp. Z2-YC6860]|uniref:DUF4286 family protein n=1 Tax=Rhodoplanes sp. Z2-YC6860 TaxID=674703 RepID=UPI00078DDE2C|nr:DUF4286 family protein [Rhodoplanes sp. Z2-YC6860]AMN41657.1 hypothetical protein RHPLAN_32220 [Rhodoplanes sp. Z2-YC6860]
MRGESALLLWNDYRGSDEAAFHEWYNRRHIPERVPGLPGFLRARRFAALSGGPKFIALYDLASAAALTTLPYRALLDNLDSESRHFVPQFGNASKTILSVVARADYGEGAVLAAIGFDAPHMSTSGEAIARLVQRDGIVAAHLLRLDAAAKTSAKPTRPDDLALPFVLLVEATSEQNVAGLQADECLGLPRDTVVPLRQGVFRLIFTSLP